MKSLALLFSMLLCLSVPLLAAPAAPIPASQTAKSAPLPGKIVFRAGFGYGQKLGIFTMNADGSNQTRLTNDDNNVSRSPRFSPDGKKIAFTQFLSLEFEDDIYLMNADGTGLINLTHSKGDDSSPCFSPDGKKIAWMSMRGGNWEVYLMNLDGTQLQRITDNNKPRGGTENRFAYSSDTAFYNSLDFSPDGLTIIFKLYRDRNENFYTLKRGDVTPLQLTKSRTTFDNGPRFSPDGKKIVFYAMPREPILKTVLPDGRSVFRENFAKIVLMNSDGSQQTDLTNSRTATTNPCFSPDGKKILFGSSTDSRPEIWVMSADGKEQMRLVEGTEPDWAPGFVPAPQKAAKK